MQNQINSHSSQESHKIVVQKGFPSIFFLILSLSLSKTSASFLRNLQKSFFFLWLCYFSQNASLPECQFLEHPVSLDSPFPRKVYGAHNDHNFIHFKVANDPVIWYEPFFFSLAILSSFDVLGMFARMYLLEFHRTSISFSLLILSF